MRLAFMGSPDFAVPVLDALHGAGHDIIAVYAQPPRPAGRGKQPRSTPVQSRAQALGLNVLTPRTLRVRDEQARFAALDLDAAVVAAYGLILPQPILEAPRRGCLNVHPSLLPRWRGAAPIQRAVMAGDAITGVCIMQMEAGLDTGPVLLREQTPIGAGETAGELHDRLSAMGAALMLRALEEAPEPVTQGEHGVTYAAKIDKAEARIDWSRSAAALRAHVHGLAPFPGAWTMLDGERVKVLGAQPEEGSGPPGALLDDALLVACGDGALRLTRLQRSGKGVMDAATFLRGFAAPCGAILA